MAEVVNSVGMKLVSIPAGSFRMGGLNTQTDSPDGLQHGLAGKTYGTEKLQMFNGYMVLADTQKCWDEITYTNWSTRLKGFLIAPVSGEIEFVISGHEGFRFDVADQSVVDTWDDDRSEGRGSITVEAGVKYPVRLELYVVEGTGEINLQWRCPGEELTAIPIEAFEPPVSMKGKRLLTELDGPYCYPYGEFDTVPVRQVTISQPFLMSQEVVTAEQYRRFDPEYVGSGPATGVNWHDAVAYCKWLSALEGKTYRLPTEAEWEYTARAGGDRFFGASDSLPAADAANAWGLKGKFANPAEWVADWYARYPAEDQTDPVGPDAGFAKVFRGGRLYETQNYNFALAFEEKYKLPEVKTASPYFYRAAWRGAIEPDYPPARAEKVVTHPALVGTMYSDPDLKDKYDDFVLPTWDADFGVTSDYWGGLGRRWSARAQGVLTAPVTGDVIFAAEANDGLRLYIDGDLVIDGWGREELRTGTCAFEEGKQYDVKVEVFVNATEEEAAAAVARFDPVERRMILPEQELGKLKLFWEWDAQERQIVPMEFFEPTEIPPKKFKSPIGFRVVQAVAPVVAPDVSEPPFAFKCVKQTGNEATAAPDPSVPWLRVRPLVPIPPDNMPMEFIEAAGFWGFGCHNEAPAVVVCPNGDVLVMYYSAPVRPGEYFPGVRFIIQRLRFGSDQWDFPEIMLHQGGIVGAAVTLWNDNSTVRMIFGGVGQKGVPFKLCYSGDNGATWSDLKVARLTGIVGTFSPQPHPSALRDSEGRMLVCSDGVDHSSMLWASDDEGESWTDTGGRTYARHTPFVLLKDGRILGCGGKNASMDGNQPLSFSSDGGRTWDKVKSVFPAVNGKQRPSVIRLRSGRLFYASDFQRNFAGVQPEGYEQKGSFVALSEDEGLTWHIKCVEAARQMEVNTQPLHCQDHPFLGPDLHQSTNLGYCVAAQGPNGLIHLITSFNHPNVQIEMNEAWILSDAQTVALSDVTVEKIEERQEHYPNGELKCQWAGFTSGQMGYLLHGQEVNYFEDGRKEYEAAYERGRKVGAESLWSRTGQLLWTKEHDGADRCVWTQYWSNGKKRSQSHWCGFYADGVARGWDKDGVLEEEVEFIMGHPEGL